MANSEVEKAIVEFADDLRKIMIKHGVWKMRIHSWGEIVIRNDQGIRLDGVDFFRNEDPMEMGKLTLDQCLDKHNQFVHTANVTKDPYFLEEANEIMEYIKRRFWEVEQ